MSHNERKPVQHSEAAQISPEQQAVTELSAAVRGFLDAKYAPAVTLIDRTTGRNFTLRQATDTPSKAYPDVFKTVTEFVTPDEISYSFVDNSVYGQESCSWHQGDDKVQYAPDGVQPQNSVALDLESMGRLHQSIVGMHTDRVT